VYDEGGVLDMTLAGYPSWTGQPTGTCDPMPTPWQLNVGRKGTVTLADLTGLGTYAPPQNQIDKIVGWRNYATTVQTFSGFPSTAPSFTTDCAAQSAFGDYVLDFGDPPFAIDNYFDVLDSSTDPLTSVSSVPVPSAIPRTDQGFMTRQELLKLRSSLGFSQNVLQYMGTFSRARNRPAPDWPWLGAANTLTERWNINNLDLLKPDPCFGGCQKCKRKKKFTTCKSGEKKKGRGAKCGDGSDAAQLFGLWWKVDPKMGTTGFWKYVGQNFGSQDPCSTTLNFTMPEKIMPVTGSASAPHQNDFFQVLHFALWGSAGQFTNGDTDKFRLMKTFSVGASLIDQYDADDNDLDVNASPSPNPDKLTHTTIICFREDCKADHPNTDPYVAFGMETGDVLKGKSGAYTPKQPERPDHAANPRYSPSPLPSPATAILTTVVNHALSGVGEFGYAVYASGATGANNFFCDDTTCPTLKFDTLYTLPCTTGNCDPVVLDLFSYNPVSSAYPRAGIVNLNTRNAPVLAAILTKTLLAEATATPAPGAIPPPIPPPGLSPTAPPSTSLVTSSTALTVAQAIVNETSAQPALTRADVARLVAVAGGNIGSASQQKEAIARALTEVVGTRSWSLLVDVIAQTGKYKPNAPNLTGSNFVVEGEKRYWLHIALSRDPLHSDRTPCLDGIGCQVDVIGTQLEEVVE
jgi:hypothetical protein